MSETRPVHAPAKSDQERERIMNPVVGDHQIWKCPNGTTHEYVVTKIEEGHAFLEPVKENNEN
jgi:hypothetical protein